MLTTKLNEEKAANTKLNTVALRKGGNAKASDAACCSARPSEGPPPRYRGAAVFLRRLSRAKLPPNEPGGKRHDQPSQ